MTDNNHKPSSDEANSSPQNEQNPKGDEIKQNVVGTDNQVVAEMKDGTVIGKVADYVYITFINAKEHPWYYITFCILVTLFIFFIMKDDTDIEYIMAKMQNQHTYFIPDPEFSENDMRKDYYYDLLRLVLREAYPDKKIVIKNRKIDTNQGRQTDALNRGVIDLKNRNSRIKIDITWMMQNSDRNALAKNIDYFPLTLGFLSHRLCLVYNNNSKNHKVSNKDIGTIRNKDLFVKQVHVTQVKYWPDSDFLRNDKDIRLSETENYDESIKQLLHNQANCFLRGLNEVYVEQKQLNEMYSNSFSVANNFYFQYFAPEYFYVSRENIELAEKMKEGLTKTLKSGKLLCIYKHYFSHFIQKANLKKSNEIFIGSALSGEVPKFYLDFTKEYTNIFKDIEKQQTVRLSSSECYSLIDELRDRSK
jgi:hypothetical protein